jgi:hypothetical protein
VAWLNGDTVHDLDGNGIAFVQGAAVYDYSGQQIGYFNNGYFRDENGDSEAAQKLGFLPKN